VDLYRTVNYVEQLERNIVVLLPKFVPLHIFPVTRTLLSKQSKINNHEGTDRREDDRINMDIFGRSINGTLW
jgi:hypothetical protein